MKLKERVAELENTVKRYKGVIRILEADVKKSRREGAEDLAKALMRAYSTFDKGHMVSAGNILKDIAFFSKKYTESLDKENEALLERVFKLQEELERERLNHANSINAFEGTLMCARANAKELVEEIRCLKKVNRELNGEVARLQNILFSYSLQYGTVMDQREAAKRIRKRAIEEYVVKLVDTITGAMDESHDNPNGSNYDLTDVYDTIAVVMKKMTEEQNNV